MPIYEYRCSDCGHELEALQKISDPKLTTCPQCGAEALSKLVSASAFVLKGTGWYATDFRDKDKGSNAKSKPAGESGDDAKADAGESKSDNKAESSDSNSESKTESKKPEAKDSGKTDSKPAKKAAAE